MDRKILLWDFSRGPDRDGFLTECRQRLIGFLYSSIPDFQRNRPFSHFLFMVIFREILKNVYDHAGGYGLVRLVRRGNSIRFWVLDYSCRTYDFDEIMANGSSKFGNGINCGLGMETIIASARAMKINLTVNTASGFWYHGILSW